jgi:hypothetical protein
MEHVSDVLCLVVTLIQELCRNETKLGLRDWHLVELDPVHHLLMSYPIVLRYLDVPFEIGGGRTTGLSCAEIPGLPRHH